jgi:peptide/nickel transport system substrate-binding protein
MPEQFHGTATGGIDRRTLLQRMAIMGLSVPLAGVLGRTIAHAQQTPKKGGILNAIATSDPPNFDPFSNTTSAVLTIAATCYNSLIMYNPVKPDEIIGDLAKRWEISPDGLSYTFYLIDNAHFSDGKPLTAADVKATFDYVRAPPPGATSARKSLLAAVSEITIIDPYTVRFALSRPSPALLSSLATGWFIVAAKHVLESKGNLKNDVVGSGPYMLGEWQRGVSLSVVRNPNYHIPDRPYLDGITFYVVPDTGTALSYLTTGRAHLWAGVPGNDARRLKAENADAVNVFEQSSYIGDPFSFNTRRKPFDDVRVRQALAMSIDRKQALKVVNDGDGDIAGVLPSTPWGLPKAELEAIPGYGTDAKTDREKARKLLAEAGYPNGFSTTIVTRRGQGTHDARGVFLADQFEKIGVKTTLEPLESATYFERMRGGQFDIATTVVAALANDPDFLIGDYYPCNGGLNYGASCSAEIDRLFSAQSQQTDPAERLRLTHELERAVLKDYGTIVLYFKGKFAVTSKNLHNFVMHPEPDNNRRMQDVWLDE